jgi:hypothetical protein
MDGKQNETIFILFLIFLSNVPVMQQTILSPALLRGGLVYSEEARRGPIYINQDYMFFVRTAETSILERSAQTTRDFTTLYHVFCTRIANLMGSPSEAPERPQENSNGQWEIILSPFTHHIRDAAGVCKSMGGRLPEIRDKASYDRIRARAQQEDVTKIPAGVYFDTPTKRFRYMSDGANARDNSPFPVFTYGGDYEGMRHKAQWEDDKWLTDMASRYAVIYNWPQQEFDIRLASTNDLNAQEKIMCEKERDTSQQLVSHENNLLLQLTHHACQRDRKSIISSTQYLINEIEAVTNLNITVKERPPQMEDFFPQFIDSEASIRTTRASRETTQANHRDEAEEDSQSPPLQQQQNADPTMSTTTDLKSQGLDWWLQGLRQKPRPRRSTKIPEYFKELHSIWRSAEILGQHDDNFAPWLRTQLDSEYRAQLKDWVTQGYALPPPKSRLEELPIPTEDALDQLENTGVSGTEVLKLINTNEASSHMTDLNTAKDRALKQYFWEISTGNKYNLKRKDYNVKWPHQPYHQFQWSPPITWTSTTTTTTSTTPPPTTTTTASINGTTVRPHLLDHGNRTRRTPIGPIGIGIAAGIGGIAMANSISSSITGEAPLSWAGQALSALLGIPTSKREAYAEIAKMAKSIETLKINQQEIATMINMVNKRQQVYGDLIRGTYQATATITMEQDLKMIIRHLQTVQQLTLAKYANVLLAASLQKTSPYALSQRELDSLANEVKTKRGLHLGRSLSEVRTTATIVDNQITLIFEVPVMDEGNLFNFFRITPLPVFAGNQTLMPEIDSAYIGISKTGSEYVMVSPDQFTRCVTEPATCQISSPISPMSTKSSCVISTYITQKLTCPLMETDRPQEPVLHITGNRTIFSVPKETTLYVKCSEHSFSNKYEDASITITGMGEAVFRQSCTITLPDGTKFETPSAPHTQKLTDLHMFELLRHYPIPTDVVIRRMPELQLIPELSLREVQVPSSADMALHTFHPMKALPFLSQMAVFILFVIITASILYCCRHKIRRSIQNCTCGLCCKETNTERQERRSKESEAMLSQLAADFDKLKTDASANISRWSSGSKLFLSNFGRSKSTADIDTLRYSKTDSQSCDSLPPPPPPACPTLQMPSAQPRTTHYVYTPLTKSILKNVQFQPPITA